MNGNGDRTSHNCGEYEDIRHDMVARQIHDRGIRSPRVLAAMESVPRHLFVPPDLIGRAYADEALPSSDGQTNPQAFGVAPSNESIRAPGHQRVLEVGAGTGYQAAVLSLLARE